MTSNYSIKRDCGISAAGFPSSLALQPLTSNV